MSARISRAGPPRPARGQPLGSIPTSAPDTPMCSPRVLPAQRSRSASASTTSSWSASVTFGPSGRLSVRSEIALATGKSSGRQRRTSRGSTGAGGRPGSGRRRRCCARSARRAARRGSAGHRGRAAPGRGGGHGGCRARAAAGSRAAARRAARRSAPTARRGARSTRSSRGSWCRPSAACTSVMLYLKPGSTTS